VHQLVARSGLAPRDQDFPLWLQEGLAMQFEASQDGVWAGIGGVNRLRAPAARSLDLSNPRLALPRLVSDADYEPGYDSQRYAAAYSLVEFLQTKHRADWIAFIDQLRIPESTPSTRPERFLARFRAAFGDDLEPLAEEWRRRAKTANTR
jgi:hypothetical protein